MIYLHFQLKEFSNDAIFTFSNNGIFTFSNNGIFTFSNDDIFTFSGESILLCKPNEKPKALTLVQSALPPVQSTLIRHEGERLSSSMKRAILEVVVSGVAMAPKDVALYASCTLLAASVDKDTDKTQDLIDECIAFLQENEFVCSQKVTENGEVIFVI